MTPFKKADIDHLSLFELRDVARELGVPKPTTLKRENLLDAIEDIMLGRTKPAPRTTRGRPTKSGEKPLTMVNKLKQMLEASNYERNYELVLHPEEGDVKEPQLIGGEIDVTNCEIREGVLDITGEGFGFVRVNRYLPGELDCYVSNAMIQRLKLRSGDVMKGYIKDLHENKHPAMVKLLTLNGIDIEQYPAERPEFENLTPVYPDQRLRLETDSEDAALRTIDLIAPIGKGQRGIVVAPPKAGKTILLKKIAQAISENNPEVSLFILLIDERPEEVSDMKESLRAEVVASTFDEKPENHVKVAELVLAKAKRMVEMGKDVVIILDSLTRLVRSFNQVVENSGKTLTGGLDISALQFPKQFFGAARNLSSGGSLTILASALVETGSRMDEIIFEEFKGRGNMEIYLSRRLSEKRIFPAIDINRSGTRREELLLTGEELNCVMDIRSAVADGDARAQMEKFSELIVQTRSNAELIEKYRKLL